MVSSWLIAGKGNWYKVDEKNPLIFVFWKDTEEKDSYLLRIIHFLPHLLNLAFSKGDQTVSRLGSCLTAVKDR